MIKRWWDRFWFAPEPPVNLAAARIIFALHALWVLLSRDLAATANLPQPFWTHVGWSDQWRFLEFPGHGGLEHALQMVAVLALVGVTLGYRPRLTSLIAAVLLYHLAPFETIYVHQDPLERGFTMSVLALTVLAFAPCADVWSVTNRAARPKIERPAWEYRWALMLVQLFVAQIYLFAGYSKLLLVGPQWMFATNQRLWFLYFSQIDQDIVFSGFARFFADHLWLCGLVGIGAIALDLGFILVLVWPRSRRVIIPLAVLFHLGILFTDNIFFINLPQLLIFVNWDWLVRRWADPRSRVTGPQAA